MALAPITLFVYNRPGHTRRTVTALQKNKLASASDLIIYADAPKNSAAAAAVAAVRSYLKTIDGFKSVTIIERPENFGLARSIIEGVTTVVERYGKIIVLEDDLVSAPYFLDYMNGALDLYAARPEVVSIHGYIYPVRRALPETFFLRGADCWGWATWQRGWKIFEVDGKKLLDSIRAEKLGQEFDWDGAYPYTQLLRAQVAGLNDSWAIRWHASAFLAGRLTLYPGRSLIENVGLDRSGTHHAQTDWLNGPLAEKPIRLEMLPAAEDRAARAAIKEYFGSPRLRLLTAGIRLKTALKLLAKNL